MEILLPFILIGGGLFAIFYIRPKTQNSVMEIKYMQTKKVSELVDMFSQMEQNGLGNDYREFVEIKGNIVSNLLVEAPFSGRKVAYCHSALKQVTEEKEQYRDSNGYTNTRVIKHETTISDEKSSQEISVQDASSQEELVLEINGTGCKLDIPKTFDRFEPKTNLSGYGYFRNFSWSPYGAETLGFRMLEETIEPNQSLYIIGEAFRVGDKIHIGKPQDSKKPFIVTTKSEEDLVNQSKQNAMIYLIGGIAAILIGVVLLFKAF